MGRNYKGVWHLGNGSTLSGADSSNQLNGTNHSATAVTGKAGGGAGFNGSNQNVSVGTSGLTSGITLEAWIYRTGANGFDIWSDFGWNSTDGFVALIGGPNGNKHGFVKHAVLYIDSNVSSTANTWEHVVWTVDSDKKPRLYVNGSLAFTSTDTQSLVASTHGGSLGSRLDSSGNASQYFTGNLDEVRLSSTVRSADWIATEYNNQNSPSTFYAVSSASGAPASVHWLVTDQLGTPRMVFDQSGSLANTSRHDYLPFGEELFAGTGGRTTALGYTGADGARQKFTGYERDTESGLDYAHARYYANMQGRFTSPDPFAGSMNLRNPQSLNRYTYVRNNPVKLVDPSGLDGAKFSMNSLDGNDIQNFINSQGDGAGEANVLADENDAMNEAAAESDAPPPPPPAGLPYLYGDGTVDSAQGEQDDPGDAGVRSSNGGVTIQVSWGSEAGDRFTASIQ